MLLGLLFCLVFLGLNSSKAHGATQVIGGVRLRTATSGWKFVMPALLQNGFTAKAFEIAATAQNWGVFAIAICRQNQ